MEKNKQLKNYRINKNNNSLLNSYFIIFNLFLNMNYYTINHGLKFMKILFLKKQLSIYFSKCILILQ